MKPDTTIHAAFAAALAEMPSPALDRTNTAYGRFRYASLGSFLDATRPTLARHGLAMSSDFEPTPDGNLLCWTVIRNATGETIRLAPVPIKVDLAKPQTTGSHITYARRYSLSAALGVVGDEDDDGNAASASEPAARPAAAKPFSQAMAAMPAKPRAIETKAAPAPATEPDGDFRTLPIVRVKVTEGERNGKPWVRYAVCFREGNEDVWASTFDRNYGEFLNDAAGGTATVAIRPGKVGMDIVAVEMPPAAPATKEADDDLPF
jgi:hypothetical protein